MMDTPTDTRRRVTADALGAWISSVLKKSSVSDNQTARTTDALLEADLRGLHTHGIEMLPRYSRGFLQGHLNSDARPHSVQTSGAVSRWDGDNGLGHFVSDMVTDWVADAAAEYGIAAASVYNSNHFGIAARYAKRLANAGLISYVTTNTPPVMPAHGGRTSTIGNNPLAWSIPRGNGHAPIVLDMAVSASARGRVRLAASAGEAIPFGWALDGDGNPTTDAAAAMMGTLLPIAGTKGYGLAVINEMLSAALSGAKMLEQVSTRTVLVGDLHDHWGVGHFIMALDPAKFIGRDQYEALTESAVKTIKASSAPGDPEILLPGEPEERTYAAYSEQGIPIADHIWLSTTELSKDLGIDAPQLR